MSATCWNPAPSPIFDANGNLASGAKAYFYEGGTTAPLTVYSDAALSTAHTNPVVANSVGVFSPIFLPYGDYRIRILSSDDALIFDADNIANPEPPSSGGGAGIVVSSDMVFQTGDPIWVPTSATRSGFVRMNLKTIGSAVSGATERANADTEDLFLYLWTNFSNTDAPVSTGRGASAAADWAANKTIGVPTMKGLLALGVDDMGGTAAQQIQITGTCDVTNGLTTTTVSSATGLGRGMYFIIDSVASGQITNISGTTVTLDTAYVGATDTGLAFRASYFSDAQSVGVVGGSQSFTATTVELPAHTHGVTDPGHIHAIAQTADNMSQYLAGTPGYKSGASTLNTASATTGISIQSAGSGLPSQIVQPGRLGYWWMKL